MNRPVKLILFICLSVVPLISGMSQTQTKKANFKVRSVIFKGNQHFSDRQLHTHMLSRPSTLLFPSRFRAAQFDQDLKNLILFYRQQGFLDALIQDHSVRTDSSKKRVDITIEISEGIPTLLEGFTLFSNRIIPDSILMQDVTLQKGRPLLSREIKNTTLRMLTRYANLGYTDAQVVPDVRIQTETQRAFVDFHITEGHCFRIDTVRYIGLKKIRPVVIRRELVFQSGDTVKYQQLLESQRRLYLTGLFQNVAIRPADTETADSTKKDIVIEVRENRSFEFSLSAGFGSLDKMRVKSEMLNNNLFGRGLKTGISARFSAITQGVEASFTEPWTFGIPWRTDIRVLVEWKQEPGYDLQRAGFQAVFGRSLRNRSSVNVSYRLESTRLYNIRAGLSPADQNSGVNSLKFTLGIDTRDNLFNVSRGSFFELSQEIGRLPGLSSPFYRTFIKYKIFRQAGSRILFGSSIETGWIHLESEAALIPLHERLYAGGPNSIRGLTYQGAGPLDQDGTPLGGRLKILFNILEIRIRIYKYLGMAGFIDSGNVWADPKDFRFRDVRLTPGAGIRAETPLGAIRLDLGWNIFRLPGERTIYVSFSIGQAF